MLLSRLWVGALLLAPLGVFADEKATEEASVDEPATLQQPGSAAWDACGPGERWTFSDDVRARWREEIERSIGKSYSNVRGFSGALALRRQSTTQPELKTLAEYWMARSMLDAKMTHIAHRGFHAILQIPPRKRIRGIQFAALECLSRIQEKFPSLGHQPEVRRLLPQLVADAKSPEHREVVNYALTQLMRDQVAENRPKSELKQTLDLLKGQGIHEAFAKLLYSAKLSDHSGVINEGQRFLAEKIPTPYKRFKDTTHLLLSRSFFSTENFDAAANHLQLVSKASNELTHALQELTWAFLQAEKYPEAIGTAMNLQQGGLRNTFAPEAPMVMAMALNEVCQYPSSLGAIGSFRKTYEMPYKWLEGWVKEAPDASQSRLYKEAVKFLAKRKDQPSEVPSRVGTEWVRSPVFIAHQGEINLLMDSRESVRKFSAAASAEQNKVAKAIVDDWRNIKHLIQQARTRMKPGDTLPGRIRSQIADLRYDIKVFQRMWMAAPVWGAISESHLERAPVMEKRLVKRINEDLSERSLNMYTQILEIAENNQLIEVEIYNGASQDIIWQNAHPEYKELAKELKEETRRKNAERVWDWGRAPAHAEEHQGGEIWEDELGSFRAEMVNNCESKDKYLTLMRGGKRK